MNAPLAAQETPRSLATWNGRLTAIGSAAALNLAFMPLFLKPAVVSDFIQDRGFTSVQAGSIVTVEFLALSAMLLLASRWRRRLYYLPTSLLGAALACLAAFACIYVSSYTGLLALRVMSALGTGLLMIAANMAFAGFEKPDVMFARINAINLVFGSLALMLLPHTASLVGNVSPFAGYLCVAVLLFPFMLLMPRRESSPPQTDVTQSGGALNFKSRQILWLAAGTAAFALALGQVWGFFWSLGSAAGLSTEQLSSASSLTLIGSVVGSLLGGRASRSAVAVPIFRLALVSAAAGFLLVILAPQPLLFVIGGVVAMSSIYFVYPTVLGAASGYDTTGRGVVLINGAQSLMSGSGPMVAGIVMDAGGSPALSVTAVACTAAALLLYEMVWRDTRRVKRAELQVEA